MEEEGRESVGYFSMGSYMVSHRLLGREVQVFRPNVRTCKKSLLSTYHDSAIKSALLQNTLLQPNSELLIESLIINIIAQELWR